MAKSKNPGAGMRQSPEASITVVSERAVLQRVQRILARDGDRLRKCRWEAREYIVLGSFYIVDDRNVVTDTHVNLEQLARDLGAMQPQERMEG